MEQLVLYVKALRALNLSLLFAQGEIRVGHLKPSNAVKNGKVYVFYIFIQERHMRARISLEQRALAGGFTRA